MLVPNDILSAKLLIQLKYATAEVVRKQMKVADADPNASRDVLALLLDRDLITQKQAERARYFTALFVHLRREAILLRIAERKHDLPRDQVLRVLAEIELSSYRHHLSVLLPTLGLITTDEAERLKRRTHRRIVRDNRRVLERYRDEDFRGVVKALIPVWPLTDEAFRITTLFRTEETLRGVNWSKRRLSEVRNDQETSKQVLGSRDDELELGSFTRCATTADDSSDETGALEDEAEDAGKSRWATARIQEGHWQAAGPSEHAQREVIGPYQVVQCLGEGGMGAVYLCTDGSGLVAVKVMTSPSGSDDLQRFEREGQIYAQLAHPNLIHLLASGETEDGAPFLVLPVFAGESLQEVLNETKILLEPGEVFLIMEQALAGLEAAHKLGIIHRDVKPDNLFLLAGASGREVKLIDFGIARFLDDLKPDADRAFRTELTSISGTPAYVAPETINSGRVDARTDIYSLGIMFFLLLTGRHPLHVDRSSDFLSEHLVGIPLTLKQARNEFPWCPELETLLASMMAKRLVDRPASCQEILDLIQGGGLRELTLRTMTEPPRPSRPASGRLSRLFNQFFKHDR